MPEYEEIEVTIALRIRVAVTDSAPTRQEAREMVIACLRGHELYGAPTPTQIVDAAPRISELE